MASDQSGAQEVQIGAVGVCVVNGVAAALGVTGIPGPVTDLGDEIWLAWAPIMGQGDRATLGSQVFHVPLNSRAQRKLPGGSEVAVVVENSSATNAFQAGLGLSVLVSN